MWKWFTSIPKFSSLPLLAETDHSRLYVDRDQGLVYKEVLDLDLFQHEEKITRLVSDRSDHLTPLLSSDAKARVLVLPAAQYDLHTWLYDDVKESHERNERFVGFLLQIIQGLYDLYMNHVEHYDIKAQNILLFADSTAKIADFGCAVYRATRYQPMTGTFPYMAPELTKRARDTVYVAHSMDVYSTCVMIIHVLFPWLMYPMSQARTREQYRQFHDRVVDLLREHHINDELASLLVAGLHDDPSQRISLLSFVYRMTRLLTDHDAVLSHPSRSP